MTNKLYYFEQTTSTFDEAAKIKPKGGDIICAKVQTSGRGRTGREWKSDIGGIYFSLIIEPEMEPDKMQIITIICALGVQKALSAHVKCFVKWPNDIVSEKGQKLCGILSKASLSAGETPLINVGIGINANNYDFGSNLPYASSLKEICGYEVNENKILCDVVECINEYCRKEVDDITKEFSDVCINIGSKVKAIYHKDNCDIEGKCIGIDSDGALLIQKDDSEVVSVNSGEVSVRGIYGYV
ncbi:MAG: biotin--[acetyl-CoA-carboxylase] ligase [Clostridia bacterium]|nr:biotin--[acetyl-CoA-carboxylase] ligase [Clostridia bacterium]